MKRTGIRSFFTFAAVGAALLLCGCDKEDTPLSAEYLFSYGTISLPAAESAYTIWLDNGAELIIETNMVPNIKVQDRQRVIAQYTILDEAGLNPEGIMDYYIRLDMLYGVLSKPYVLQSEIDAGGADLIESIGNDPVEVEEAFFGGGFLNVTCGYPQSTKTHTLTLVYDDVESDGSPERGDTAYLSLRHNALNDAQVRYVYSYASFPIVSLLVIDGRQVDERPVKLRWLSHNGMRSRKGTFRRNAANEESAFFRQNEIPAVIR